MKDNELTESNYIKPVIEKLDLAKELVENFLIYEEENNELSVRLLGEKIGSINKDRMLQRANELPQIEDVEDYNEWVSDVYKEIFNDKNKNPKIKFYDFKKLPNNRIIISVLGENGGGFQWINRKTFRKGIEQFSSFEIDDLVQHIGSFLNISGLEGPGGFEIIVALHEFLRRNESFIDYDWQQNEFYLVGVSNFRGKDERYICRIIDVKECSVEFKNFGTSKRDFINRKAIKLIHDLTQDMMDADPHYESDIYHESSRVLSPIDRFGVGSL